MKKYRFTAPRWTLACALAISTQVFAVDYAESLQGDFSNARLDPTRLLLSYGGGGNNGLLGNNILSGSTGRNADGMVDLDYINFVVPTGFVLHQLRVGNLTAASGNSFIGMSAGAIMPLTPAATSAVGLLGWKQYSELDRNTDILDDMAVSANGASGFSIPLTSGDYTLWIQDLSPGSYNYRLNLQIAPVPEPSTCASLLAGLGLLAYRLRLRKHSYTSHSIS